MTKFLNAFVRDESGAAAAEYALILAIVGAGIAGAAYFLGTQISSALTGAGTLVCADPGNGSLCTSGGSTSGGSTSGGTTTP